MTTTNIFGFSTEPSSGNDFIPIIKFDARAGRIFRIDRTLGNDGWLSDSIDITHNFRAVMDFENVEVGWLDFPAGSAPSFALVPMGQPLPQRPSPKHKNGLRVLLKLDKACGGERRIREIAGSAKSFLGGVEQVYAEYLHEKAQHPGQLPVLSLAGTTPITTGSGATKSTNYRPNFRIDGWVPRPADLVHVAVVNTAAAPAAAPSNGNGAHPLNGKPDFAEYNNGYTPPRPISKQDEATWTAPWDEVSPRSAPQTGGQVVNARPAPNPQGASLEDDFG